MGDCLRMHSLSRDETDRIPMFGLRIIPCMVNVMMDGKTIHIASYDKQVVLQLSSAQ